MVGYGQVTRSVHKSQFYVYTPAMSRPGVTEAIPVFRAAAWTKHPATNGAKNRVGFEHAEESQKRSAVSKRKGTPSSRIRRLGLAAMAHGSTHARQDPGRLPRARPECRVNPRAPEQPGEK